MRIVIDTNVFISALFFDGMPEKVIDLVLSGAVTAVITHEIFQEYEDTLHDMIQKARSKDFRFSFSDLLERLLVVEPQATKLICRDPDDDKFIDCALSASCDYIVSGDKDLLVLKSYENIKILTVREFLDKGHYI